MKVLIFLVEGATSMADAVLWNVEIGAYKARHRICVMGVRIVERLER